MHSLDVVLDEYEAMWCGSETPPDVLEYVARLPGDVIEQGAMHELALIDMEWRWRTYFRPGIILSGKADNLRWLPRLPTWADYCRLLEGRGLLVFEGVCREYRVRQLFGDRPNCSQFAAASPSLEAELNLRLPELAAELTRATVCLIRNGLPRFSCPLPGVLEVGRRRVQEPSAPALVDAPCGQRLIVVELPQAHISRSQFRLKVVAKDRLLVQHSASHGYVDCIPGGRLTKDQFCEVSVPCQLVLAGLSLRIERLSR
jgi:hypothetical protein